MNIHIQTEFESKESIMLGLAYNIRKSYKFINYYLHKFYFCIIKLSVNKECFHRKKNIMCGVIAVIATKLF